jgi:hypothetical protein
MKTGLIFALGVLLSAGTAMADEYRGDVFSPGYSELDIDFANSKYDSQVWMRPSGFANAKYHDTLIILHSPGCVRIETGAPPPYTGSTDTMLFLSYSNDTSDNNWNWLDDDSGYEYLSTGYLRYESGSGQRRVRIRTTGYDSNINSQHVNIHITQMALSECPASGGNVAIL